METTHEIVIVPGAPGRFAAILRSRDTHTRNAIGIGEGIQNALRELERTAGDNIAMVPVVDEDGKRLSTAWELL